MNKLDMRSRLYGISAKRSDIEQYQNNLLGDQFKDVGPRLPGIAVQHFDDQAQAQKQFERLQSLGLNVGKDW